MEQRVSLTNGTKTTEHPQTNLHTELTPSTKELTQNQSQT